MEVLPAEELAGSEAAPSAAPEPEEISYPEEAKDFKEAARTWLPTQAEIDKHRIDHIPYRVWCPECLEGFGRERAHHAHGEDRTIPLVCCDYFFLSDKGVFARHEISEDEKTRAVKVMALKCARTGCLFAHAVP